jgi:ABC-type polar amino acid transport system ATPase subunit
MKKDVVDVMGDFAKDGLTMLIVTHEPAVVNQIATRILKLGPLGVIEEDRSIGNKQFPTSSIQNNP